MKSLNVSETSNEVFNSPKPPIRLSKYQATLDRGSSKIRELAWVVIKAMFFTPSFPLPSAWRVWWLRRFGGRIGKRVVIRSGVNITFPWRLTVEDDVWIGEDVLLLNLVEIHIESNSCISQRAFLCTGSHDFRKETFDLITKPIVIKSGSWICAQAFIGPGVTVGPNSMVCAGTVISKDLPQNSVARTEAPIVVAARSGA
jgi:putative colanic acid biosynthesis acetyltransferase WcaF